MGARHILLFLESLAGGGVERIALRLAGGWARAGRRVTIVGGSFAGPLAAEIPPGVKLVDLGTGTYPALSLATISAITALAPDVLVCPGNYYSAIAVAARIALGRRCPPIVAKISNAFHRPDFSRPAQAAYGAWLRFHSRFIDRFVALSDGMRREGIEIAGIDPRRIITIPNPAGAPFLRIGTVPREPLILGVGRLVPQKRHERLVQAFAGLPRSLGARLAILGDGPDRQAILATAARYGVAGRVTLPGTVPDPARWMAHARVVALASDYEGMPGVLAEALEVGTPVVTTACSSGIAEIVHDPRLGSIVPIGDPAAMTAALGQWFRASPDHAAIRQLAERPPIDSAARWIEEMDTLVARRPLRAADRSARASPALLCRHSL